MLINNTNLYIRSNNNNIIIVVYLVGVIVTNLAPIEYVRSLQSGLSLTETRPLSRYHDRNTAARINKQKRQQ